MAEVAPSAGGGGGNRTFLLIIGGLAALLFIGLLVLGAIFVLPGLFGGQQAAVVTATPTRIVIPATATSPAGPTATLVVVATVPSETLAPGVRELQVEVDGNQNVILTTLEGGKSPIVQNGTWGLDPSGSQITLTMTDLNGKPFKEVIVLQVQNGQLTAVQYNKALHGDLSAVQIKRVGAGSAPMNFLVPSDGRGLGLAMPAAQATETPAPVTGTYSGMIPGPQDNARLTILVLGVDASAALSTDESGKPSILQLGTYTTTNSTVTVNLTDKDGTTFADKLVLTLQNDQLVGTDYDQSVHGAGLDLKRDPASPPSSEVPAAGTYSQLMSLAATATPIPITATPIAITATPSAGAKSGELPNTGLGDDLLLLLAGALLLIGIIFVARRMRSA